MIQIISIIKFNEHYWIHAQSRTINGPWISSAPFIKLLLDVDEVMFIESLEKALNGSKQNVQRPNDWTSFNKEYLKKIGLKYSKDLYNGTKLCDIQKSEDMIDITPTRNLGVRGGFDFLTALKTTLPNTTSNTELYIKVQEAFDKCE